MEQNLELRAREQENENKERKYGRPFNFYFLLRIINFVGAQINYM